MIQNYDWKKHYAAKLSEHENSSAFRSFRIENETGTGEVFSCAVFPGIQAVYNDLYLLRCANPVPENNIIEINYCMEGRYECEVNSQYCFSIGRGDLSVGTTGRSETRGSFPTQRFRGMTLFIDLASMEKERAYLLRELDAELDTIRRLSMRKPRRFVMHGMAEFDTVVRSMASAETEHDLPKLKLKTLEFLLLLGRMDRIGPDGAPAYISQKQAQLARDVRKRITEDLTAILTIKKLSEEFHAAPTIIKSAFKSVYSSSIYAYRKSCRLLEGQRLLRDTQLPVAEVASKVGYTNPGRFSTAFHETFGLSPTDYRKSVRSDK